MNPFKHPYASRCRFRYAAASGGGLVIDAMIVTANIVLEEGVSAYDAAKVVDLQVAAVNYAKARGYKSIEFEQA